MQSCGQHVDPQIHVTSAGADQPPVGVATPSSTSSGMIVSVSFQPQYQPRSLPPTSTVLLRDRLGTPTGLIPRLLLRQPASHIPSYLLRPSPLPSGDLSHPPRMVTALLLLPGPLRRSLRCGLVRSADPFLPGCRIILDHSAPLPGLIPLPSPFGFLRRDPLPLTGLRRLLRQTGTLRPSRPFGSRRGSLLIRPGHYLPFPGFGWLKNLTHAGHKPGAVNTTTPQPAHAYSFGSGLATGCCLPCGDGFDEEDTDHVGTGSVLGRGERVNGVEAGDGQPDSYLQPWWAADRGTHRRGRRLITPSDGVVVNLDPSAKVKLTMLAGA